MKCRHGLLPVARAPDVDLETRLAKNVVDVPLLIAQPADVGLKLDKQDFSTSRVNQEQIRKPGAECAADWSPPAVLRPSCAPVGPVPAAELSQVGDLLLPLPLGKRRENRQLTGGHAGTSGTSTAS
jgi:hypothetical protein